MTRNGEFFPDGPVGDARSLPNGAAKARTQIFDPDLLLERLRVVSELLGAASTLPTDAALFYHHGANPPVVRLIGERLSIGRDATCDLSFSTQWEMSRRHFEIRRVGSRYILRDAGSFNGTMIRGIPERIGTRDLRNGDLIDAGGVTFLFTRSD